VRITWDTSVGTGIEYQVYRDDEPASSWLTATTYDDLDAAAPETVVSRCGGLSSQKCFRRREEIQYVYHDYKVKARTTCGESDFSASDTGYRGVEEEVDSDSKVREETLPVSDVTPLSDLAIRLTSFEEPIDPATVWAHAEWDGWYLEGAIWRPTVPEDNSDGWVVLTPAEPWPAGATVTLTVGAMTVSGIEMELITREFQIGAEKEDAVVPEEPGIVAMTEDADVPTLHADVISPAYRIGPDEVFEQAVPFWIPVPADADLNTLEIYYFSEAEEHRGWYLGENVIGWMVPDSRRLVEQDGQLFLEIEVNHSGILQLADSESVKVRADIGIFLALAAALGIKLASRRRKR